MTSIDRGGVDSSNETPTSDPRVKPCRTIRRSRAEVDLRLLLILRRRGIVHGYKWVSGVHRAADWRMAVTNSVPRLVIEPDLPRVSMAAVVWVCQRSNCSLARSASVPVV